MIGQSFEGHGLALHFEVEGSGFNGPEAALAPLGDDDFLSEIGFDAIAWLEAKEIGIEGLLETLLGFVGEEEPWLRAPLAREATMRRSDDIRIGS